MEADAIARRICVERLEPGDIILTTSRGKTSRIVRVATKGNVSHAMICVAHGSVIDSTDDGVQSHNIQRELYYQGDTAMVLRLRTPLEASQLDDIIDFARSEIGTRYSKLEAARTVIPGRKPRTAQMFCSRLVARSYAAGGIRLVADPDYCTPEDLRQSPLLQVIPNMEEIVSEAELAIWDARPDPLAETRRAQNEVLAAARALDPEVENFNDLVQLVQNHPEWDEEIARAYRESGYFDIWRNDFVVNPWHYDLDEMEASAHHAPPGDIRNYCVSTVREFHTGAGRYAGNLIQYKWLMWDSSRKTIAQLIALYDRLMRNEEQRREVALAWLRRHHPEDAKAHLQQIEPHSERWFKIIDRVNPRLGAVARTSISQAGSTEVCSTCGDPADDYRLVNAADTMPGVPSLRLCHDCVGVRRAGGEVLERFVR